MIIASIDDLRSLARRGVPRALFHYADGGSYDEVTLRGNRMDLEAVSFRQRVAVDVSSQTLGTTVVGQPLSLDIIRRELAVTMALTGCTDVRRIDSGFLQEKLTRLVPCEERRS